MPVSLLQKGKSGMGTADWYVTILCHPFSKARVNLLSWTRWTQENDGADRLAGKITIATGLRLYRSEVLRSLKPVCTPSLEVRRRKRKQPTNCSDRTKKDCRESDQRSHCFNGNCGEMKWSFYGLSWASRYHFGLNWTSSFLVHSVYVKCKV